MSSHGRIGLALPQRVWRLPIGPTQAEIDALSIFWFLPPTKEDTSQERVKPKRIGRLISVDRLECEITSGKLEFEMINSIVFWPIS